MSASGLALTLAIVLTCASGGALADAQPAIPPPTASPPPPARRDVRIGVVGLPTALDPLAALEGAGALVSRQIFDTLVVYREASTDVEPALALRWGVSRDGLTWSFTLRDGVRFHDGTPLTAREAAASFERWLKTEGRPPGTALVWSSLLRGVPGVVKDVRATDARTLQFVLFQPYAPLLTVLAHPGFGIAKSTTAIDGTPLLIGSGPYRLAEAAPGRMVLEAAAGHWTGGARASRLTFLEMGSDEQAEGELDARSLDVWLPRGPPRRTEGALSIPGLHVGFLALQTEKAPFTVKKIRQAVATALDPALLAPALGRAAVPLLSFLPPGAWASRAGPPVIGGGRQAVAALLREGGFPQGRTTSLLIPVGEPTTVNRTKLAETLYLMLQASDMPVDLRIEPAEAARSASQSGTHDLVLGEAAVIGGDPHFLLYPLSTSEGAEKGARASNLSFHRSPRLDDLLIRASQLSFRAERLRLYQRAQATLADEVPWIPLYVRLLWAVARPEVRGLRLHPTGIHRLHGVWLDVPS
ncbi:MAG TPA: ABC transporter substrate-binding protein [Candidatus Acidoferrum sp.]|nr:ABC transporter substrate-binding protein [Candidatus Acidoferrum sp.]